MKLVQHSHSLWQRLWVVISLSLIHCPASAVTFTFNWVVPSSADVTCTGTNRGLQISGRYDLTAKNDGASGFILVGMSDYELLDVEGASERQIAQLRNNSLFQATQGLIPNWTVNKNGRLIAISSIDPLIDAVVSRIEDRVAAEKLEKTMSSPALRQAMVARVGNYWQIWVESYIGLDISSGETQNFQSPVELGGVSFPAQIEIKHLGSVAESGEVKLRLTSTYAGHQFEVYMASMVREMANQFGKPGAQADFEIEFARKTTTIDITTSPSTLYPSSVNMTERDEIKVRGEKAIERQKRNNCTFNWR